MAYVLAMIGGYEWLVFRHERGIANVLQLFDTDEGGPGEGGG